MKHSLNLFAFFLSYTLSAQMSYTSTNYASGSYTIPMNTVTKGGTNYNFDTTGANITWNYSQLGMDVSGSKAAVSTASSGY